MKRESEPQYYRRGLSLPAKVFLGIILIGSVTWSCSDYFVSLAIRQAFDQQLNDLLEEKAFQHRVRFSRFVESYPQAVEMLAHQKRLVDYLNTDHEQILQQSTYKTTHDIPHWMGRFSFFNSLLAPSYVLLYDSNGSIIEIYQARSNPPPQGLIYMSPLTMSRVYGESHIAQYGGVTYLLAGEQIHGDSKEMLGTLIVATPMDEAFMVASNGPKTEWNMVALISEEEGKILVSNSSVELPEGIPLRQLRDEFLFTDPQALALVGMELHFRFASFVHRQNAESLAGEFLRTERTSHLAVTIFHVLPFVLLIIWLTRRISRLTRRIEDYSRNNDAHGSVWRPQKGDQLVILEESFGQLLRDIDQRTLELESANRELEAFAYSISHDLRAPLRSIDGFSHALVEDYGDELNEEAQDYLKRVRDAAQRMGLLIDDLLMLSRVNRGELNKTDIDLTVMATEITQELRLEDPFRQVDVKIQQGLGMHGDERLMRVALSNLIDNAWKYTGKTESPTIEVGMMITDKGPKGDVPVQTVIFVADNGAGFNMRYADKLFTPFQRLHLQEDFAGNGVGLATVQRIIHRHGGVIWAEGIEGKGATFYFSVP
ncbi:MAG: hypothetical protein C0616_01790 [Desulfuromonas sp.]|nr:MAG: hypothetical protein C0616_01790 [Desulfuromonas sp.]